MDKEVIILQLQAARQILDALVLSLAREEGAPGPEEPGNCPECKTGHLVDTTAMGKPTTFECNKCDYKREEN